MVNRFRHFVVPFTDGYTNVLRSIITRSAHQRRWYYAGCGNNMKEHRYDVCCCSARRVFAIRESASWLMKNVRNWWIYCNRPVGDKCWRTMPGGKMFSGGPARFIRAIRGVKNGCSVLYVAGYCNNHPVIVGRNINASVNFYWLIKFCLLNLYTEFLSVCVHELTIWRINTVLQNGTNPPSSPAVAGCSGGVPADRGRARRTVAYCTAECGLRHQF